MDVEAAIAKARRRAAGETLPPPDLPNLPNLLPPEPELVGLIGLIGWPETRAAGPKPVRCGACLHIDPNPHTPAFGWCGCRAGRRREHGWPAAPRVCSAFEEGPPGLN
jgi:hypothetical protein